MSWQGDQEQPPSTGRGRRRRGDSPAEDPYDTAHGAGGTGRRGSGEFERPAEYVQYAEQQAAAYDENTGQDTDYAPYQGYGQSQTGYTQAQTGYAQPGYGDTGYGAATGYEQGGYAQGGYGQSGYGDTGYATPGYDDTNHGTTSYSGTGYGDTGYGYAQAPASPQNLNSSGFYPLAEPAAPAAEPVAPPAPQAYQPPYQQPSVPQQPSYTPQAPQQPYWQQPAPAEVPQAPAPAPPAPAPPAPAVRTSRPDSRVIESHVIESHVIEARPDDSQVAEPRNVADRPVETVPEPVVAPAAPEKADKSEKPNIRGIDEDIRGFLNFVESRADSRQERARRLRFRLIVLGVLVVLIGGATGLWALLTGGSDGSKATQTTVLLQIRDANENAIGSVVLVADKNAVAGKPTPTGAGAAMLIPAELSVQNAALETQPFGGAMPTTPPAGKDALSNLLGVDVDGVWTVDELTFAAFLSNLGGVYVDVDVPVTGPTGQVLIPAGKHQQLDGTKAVAFAAFRGKDEAPAAGLARFGQVVNGMLARMPADPKTTLALLNSLAAVPDPALPNDRLAAILSALGAEQQGGRYQMQTLPVRQDGSGLIDLDAASKVVGQVLKGAAHSRDDGGLSRVAVTDGTGRLDIVTSSAMAGSKLLNGGYTPLMLGPVQSTPTSYVEVPNADGQTLGKQIAETLGLGDTAVKVTPFDTTLVDAKVVLGQDWTQIGQLPADVSTSGLPTDLSTDGLPGVPTDSPPASTTKPKVVETTPKGKRTTAKA